MKKAFTLAETLITIGIIGVVAAIVIPIITNNVQDKQHATMWKKKYSEIVNIYREVKDEFGGDICVESKTGYVKSAKCSRIGDFAKYTTLSPDFVNEFVSRLKVVDSCGKPEYGESKLCKNYDFKWVGYCHPSAYGYYGSLVQGRGKSGSTRPASCQPAGALYTAGDMSNRAVLLLDGSVIYFGGYATGMISVDVNNFTKGPNTIGRDLFVIMLNEDWAKPIGAEGTFNVAANGATCKCSKDYGSVSGQGFLGSSDLLHGKMLSGVCCSATKLK